MKRFFSASIILFYIVFLDVTLAQAQDRVGIYLCGITVHAKGDPNAALMPLKFSPSGKVIFNYGGVVHYKKYLNSRFSFDVIQTIQADCALEFSAATAISVGFDLINKGAHRFIFALGPGFYIRESWEKFDEYIRVNDLSLSLNEKWEYKFVPFVPHIEYSIIPEGKRLGFTIYGIIDPIEKVYNFGAGVNYILNDKPDKIND
jgi:hypothetical protein